MMRLLARLHGARPTADADGRRTRRSMVVGLVSSTIVIAHLAALGFGGALLFIRSGAGYSVGETVVLAGLTMVALLAFGHVVSSTVGKIRYRLER